MIAVVGGVKSAVKIKMAPPERNIEKQRKQDEEALLLAGIDINKLGNHDNPEEDSQDARFRQYYESKMREQASENYWSEVGFGTKDFGGYDPVVPENDTDIKVTSSGCSYEIAKLLGKKDDVDVAFVSIVGNDALGLAAKCELKQAGVDISAIKTEEGATPVSIEIHNIIGDLEFCRENSTLMDRITPEYIAECHEVFEKADAIFVDGSVSAETMNYISAEYADRCSIYFDPASIGGGAVFAESEMKAYCVLPGRMEAEAMSGQQVLGMDQLMEAGETFENRGTVRTIITLKGGGLYYKEGARSGIIKPERVLSFADTTGAGNALTAAAVYSSIKGADLEEAAKAGMDAAAEYLKDVEDLRPY